MTNKKDVVKSNALIEACYNPGNIYQMRVLLAAMMQIKAADEHFDHTRNFVITANALAELTGIQAGKNYRELRKAAKELRAMCITVKEKPNGDIGAPDETDINVTSSCRYYKTEGKISLRFGPEIIPYLSALRKKFTQYQAKYVLPMRSGYGIRLYELCLQWLGNEREFEVEEFKQMLGVHDKYPVIADLRKRVIDPALKDINTHSDIRVTFGQRKAGRKITHFQFMIVKSAQKSEPKKPSFDEYVELNARPGEDWKQAKQRLSPEYRKL
mgnify:CR=1 FL=1